MGGGHKPYSREESGTNPRVASTRTSNICILSTVITEQAGSSHIDTMLQASHKDLGVRGTDQTCFTVARHAVTETPD